LGKGKAKTLKFWCQQSKVKAFEPICGFICVQKRFRLTLTHHQAGKRGGGGNGIPAMQISRKDEKVFSTGRAQALFLDIHRGKKKKPSPALSGRRGGKKKKKREKPADGCAHKVRNTTEGEEEDRDFQKKDPRLCDVARKGKKSNFKIHKGKKGGHLRI